MECLGHTGRMEDKMYASIVEIAADYAGREPDRLCVADKDGAHTYGEIWRQAQAGARRLKGMGIGKNSCVMVECTQDAAFLISSLACELCGAIFVPVEHRVSKDRAEQIWKDTDAALFLNETAYDIPVRMAQVSSMAEDSGNAFSADDAPGEFAFPRAEDTAQILYTTGTTGTSKGIEMTHGSNVALAENVKYGTEMKEGNVEFIPLPLSHSHGLRCAYANLLNGSAVVLTEGVLRVREVFELIEKYKVTAMDLSPSAVLVLEQLAEGKLAEYAPQIDYIQVGTEPLQEKVKEILMNGFPEARLYNFYGSTESGRTCVLDFNQEKDRKRCIGKPARNAVFLVTDENRVPIVSSKDHMGLLASAGAMNMKGYWKQPELTAQTMQNGYVYTNDMGYIDEDGFVYMYGRKDNVINCQGIKISPEEIEEVARRYEKIIDCACVPMEDKISGQAPKLYVVVREEGTFNKKEMFDFLKRHIDANKLPKVIAVIDEIPRTSNGKIHRAKLAEGRP